jgi:hypothetical protein
MTYAKLNGMKSSSGFGEGLVSQQVKKNENLHYSFKFDTN